MICYFQQDDKWYMGECKFENNNYRVEVLKTWTYDDWLGINAMGYIISLPAEKVFFERPAGKIVNEEFYNENPTTR